MEYNTGDPPEVHTCHKCGEIHDDSCVFSKVLEHKLGHEWRRDTLDIDYAKKLEAELKKLRVRDEFLTALEQAGVDNWVGHSHAYDILGDEWFEKNVGKI